MPQVLHWSADPAQTQSRAEVVQACRQVLQAGELAVLPTDAGYAAFANTASPDGVVRLAALRGANDARRPAVAVRGVDEARDWSPEMGVLAARLARRCWPGPVILEIWDRSGSGSPYLSGGEALRSLAAAGPLGVVVPRHPALRAVLDAVPGPLVFCGLANAVSESVTTADAAARATGDLAAVIVDAGPDPCAGPATVVEVRGETWSIRSEGAVSSAEIAAAAATIILFICTGNTCRSPLAAALCKRRLADRLDCTAEELAGRGFVVTSAGIAAVYGEPAAAEAIAVARDLGADLNDHASRPATPDVLADADLVIGMTASHLQNLEGITGAHTELRLLCGDMDLSDPIGGNLEVYQGCAGMIWQHLEALIEKLPPSGRG